MMKSGYRYSRRHSQRGALDSTPSDPITAIATLAQQAEHLESRIQQLKTGINNLIQLHQGSTAPEDQQLSQTELTRLEQAVEDFELELASRLLTWQHLQEPFWQAVRYGGLGLLLGWFLHGLIQCG